jgi:hypothetical protein
VRTHAIQCLWAAFQLTVVSTHDRCPSADTARVLVVTAVAAPVWACLRRHQPAGVGECGGVACGVEVGVAGLQHEGVDGEEVSECGVVDALAELVEAGGVGDLADEAAFGA